MNLRTVIVTLLAFALLAWFLRGTNFTDVWFQVQRVRADLLLVSLAMVISTYFARTIRWRYLLSPLGQTRFRTVFRATVIGFGALAVLPVRVGDLIRPYLLARQENMLIKRHGSPSLLSNLRAPPAQSPFWAGTPEKRGKAQRTRKSEDTGSKRASALPSRDGLPFSLRPERVRACYSVICDAGKGGHAGNLDVRVGVW